MSRDDLVGEIVGEFRVLRLLDEREKGQVYLAQHLALGQEAVLKVLPALGAENDAAVRRFVEEVRVVNAMRIPGVVALLDAGTTSSGTAYVVMELLEGTSLAKRIRHFGERRIQDAVEIARQAATALGALHERGLVHRSLEPGDLMLVPERHATRRDVVKILNGSRATFYVGRGRADRVNASAAPFGNAAYVAPEQFRGIDRIDRRTDIYALGIILYEMLCGVAPFAADSVAELAHMHLFTPPDPPRRREPDIPVDLERIVLKALAKDPSERFGSMGELYEALGGIRPPEVSVLMGAVPVALAAADDRPQVRLDENVQFTVYRPRSIAAAEWRPFLAFAHLSERRPDAPASEPDPVEEVTRQAQQVLGDRSDDFRHTGHESAQAIPHEGYLTFVPTGQAIQFEPAQASFRWTGSVHRADFKVRASRDAIGTTARGRMTVYLGAIVVAEVPFGISVEGAPVVASIEKTSAAPYRKIFASYSHRDQFVVRQVKQLMTTLGDQYLADWLDLRAGETWDERLRELIRQADVFQLFWSWNAMRSGFVRQEWEYALSLGRQHFVRPTYWEDPMPAATDEDLPPRRLRDIHFARIPLLAAVAPVAEAASLAASSTKSRGRRGWLAFAAVPVAAIGLFFLVQRPVMVSQPLPRLPQIDVSAPPPVAPPPKERGPRAAQWGLVEVVDPPEGLEVTVDGVREELPIRLRVGVRSRLEFSAPGYRPRVMFLTGLAERRTISLSMKKKGHRKANLE